MTDQNSPKRKAGRPGTYANASGPVAALFAWLRGEAMTLTGWSADLSQYASGRITARRLQPAPATELTLLFEP